jgi:hypothetical protein
LPLAFALCYVAAMKAKAVVMVAPEIMSGTRVPARPLIDHFDIAFLEEASEQMLATV